MNEIEQLRELRESETKLNEHAREWYTAEKEKLTFKKVKTKGGEHHVVASGVLWIPPFVGPLSIYHKPRGAKDKPKCICADCGQKHVRKG